MIENFTDLTTWKKAHHLVLGIYQCTKKFPDDEKFSLTDQMRRASISITSNIAEGFGRNTSRDKLQFYAIAKGSLCELQSQAITAKDLGYIGENDFREFEKEFSEIGRLLGGLMKSAPSK